MNREGQRGRQLVLIAVIGVVLTEFVSRFFLPDGFGRPLYGDEALLQPTWRLLTDSSASFADRIDGYSVLSTPLPPLLFGIAERVGNGLWAPRLVVTACAVLLIWLATQRGRSTTARLQFVAGVLVVPHFLRSATVAYSDVVATLFVVLGLLAYRDKHHKRSAFWFVLGIASRQFVVAFPVAILVYESAMAYRHGRLHPRRARQLSPYLFAGATLLGWFALFGGLTPEGADRQIGNIPQVQQSIGAIDPEAGVFFLSAIGLFFVLPELVISPATSLLQRQPRWPALVGVMGLTLVATVFPFNPNSVMWGFNNVDLTDDVEFIVFFVLAALAVMRFAEWSLSSVVVGVHFVMLMKSYPWSKYALPVIVALWLLQTTTNQSRAALRWAAANRSTANRLTANRSTARRSTPLAEAAQ